ncbi:unnamed protein product, partial [Ixodes persulcatus]
VQEKTSVLIYFASTGIGTFTWRHGSLNCPAADRVDASACRVFARRELHGSWPCLSSKLSLSVSKPTGLPRLRTRALLRGINKDLRCTWWRVHPDIPDLCWPNPTYPGLPTSREMLRSSVEAALSSKSSNCPG